MENILNYTLDELNKSMENLSDFSLERLLSKYTSLENLVGNAFKYNVNEIAYKAQMLQDKIFCEINKRINGGM